jgi:hypothetical protein
MDFITMYPQTHTLAMVLRPQVQKRVWNYLPDMQNNPGSIMDRKSFFFQSE